MRKIELTYNNKITCDHQQSPQVMFHQNYENQEKYAEITNM